MDYLSILQRLEHSVHRRKILERGIGENAHMLGAHIKYIQAHLACSAYAKADVGTSHFKGIVGFSLVRGIATLRQCSWIERMQKRIRYTLLSSPTIIIVIIDASGTVTYRRPR